MMIGITTDGETYLATTALAFPEDVEFKTIELLPPAMTYEIFEGRLGVAHVEEDGAFEGYKMHKFKIYLK